MYEVMAYCQAKTMGVAVEELETIGATEKPFVCTFGISTKSMSGLPRRWRLSSSAGGTSRKAEIFDYLKTNRIDPSVTNSLLIDIDKVHQDVLQKLREKGHTVPQPGRRSLQSAVIQITWTK
jgi:hypothetical protein